MTNDVQTKIDKLYNQVSSSVEQGVFPHGVMIECQNEHEGELFARVCDHVCHEGSETVKFAVVFARHLIQQGLFAVDDFVVGDRQNEVLAPRVVDGEDQLAVDAFAEVRI